ncbi:MAG: hypothetical protein C3F17_18490, partial [Bradyrhizobiaceae bacterium]
EFRVQDDGGTANGGIDTSAPATLTIDVTPVNDPPEVDLDTGASGNGHAVTFTEGDAAVAISAAASVADVDHLVLQSATITLTNPADGAFESLSLFGALPAGISIDLGESTPHKIVMVGAASPADYAAAVDLVRYENTSEDPTAGDRTIEVVVNDGVDESAPAVSTVTVVPVNDLPTDIRWIAAPPAAGNALPLNTHVIATLLATDADHASGFTYELVSASHAIFDVSSSGTVSLTANMADATPYELVVKVTDPAGGEYQETFNIVTGTSGANNPLPTGGAGAAVLAGDDILYGHGGNDEVFGGPGDDTLFGQDGADTLTGGTGNDVLSGGANNDTYLFAATGDGHDTVDELGGGGSDTIRITTASGGATVFTDLGFARVDADGDAAVDDLLITYNGQTIKVVNFFAAGGADRIEGFDFSNGGTYLGHSLGTADYDLITGLTGANGGQIVVGTDSGETISGGNGNDLLFGNGGDDTFQYTVDSHGADLVDGGDGVDTLQLTSGGSGQTLDVVVAGGVITQFEGGRVVNVELFTADLGTGSDTLSYDGTTEGVTVDLAAGSATGFTSIANIENVTGGAGNDTLTGDDSANVLDGGGGSDTLMGGGGDDTIYVAGNDDIFHGGAGTDTLRLGSIAGGNANLQLASFSQAATGIEIVTNATGSNDVTLQGTGGSNTYDFTGVTLGNVDVDMGAGDDTVVTSANHTNGGDLTTYDGGADLDTIMLNFTAADMEGILSEASGADRTQLANFLFNPTVGLNDFGSNAGNWDNVTVANFESAKIGIEVTMADGSAKVFDISHLFGGTGSPLTFPTFVAGDTGTAGADLLVGSTSGETINGGDSNDVIVARAGTDQLLGGDGNDLLLGGAGVDTLVGGAGADVLHGGLLGDIFRYASTADGGPSIADADHILDFGDVGDLFHVLQGGAGFADGGLSTGSQATVFGKSADATFGSDAERFHYDTSTNTLWYDADGSDGGHAAVALARLENGYDLQGNQINVVAT